MNTPRRVGRRCTLNQLPNSLPLGGFGNPQSFLFSIAGVKPQKYKSYRLCLKFLFPEARWSKSYHSCLEEKGRKTAQPGGWRGFREGGRRSMSRMGSSWSLSKASLRKRMSASQKPPPFSTTKEPSCGRGRKLYSSSPKARVSGTRMHAHTHTTHSI